MVKTLGVASCGCRPGMRLNTAHCMGWPPTENDPVPNVTTAKSREAGHTDVIGREHLGGRGPI